MHGLVVIDIDRQRNLLDNFKRILQRMLESRNDDDRVNISFELRQRLGENLTSYSCQ